MQTAHDAKQLLQMYDDMSNRLCLILDVSEFTRFVHPSPEFRSAANDAYETLSSFMESELNMYRPLYDKLSEIERNASWISEMEPAEVYLLKYVHFEHRFKLVSVLVLHFFKPPPPNNIASFSHFFPSTLLFILDRHIFI